MSAGAVLISGAAGGIGAATVDRFLAGGHDVLGIDLVEPKRDDPRFRSEIADVRDPVAVVAAVGSLAGEGPISHVVGLAGAPLPGELEILHVDPVEAAELFASSLQLNLTGQFNLLRAALPCLTRADGERSITLCSSINALAGFGGPAYSAAKAGLIGMMHAMAEPLGRERIRINVVAPGTTRTPKAEAERGRHEFERAADTTHLGKVGSADDVAAAIESLTVGLTHVTDQVLRVDGGQLPR
jgi:NAD(P)-dependent dehydrogenase (short-subunit alcohol dehydrogenase family)